MNGKLVDTNILIYLSKRKLEFGEIASPKDNLYISVITYMEVLGYRFDNIIEKQTVEQLCKHFPILDLNPEIVSKVISIRQNHKIKLPDAIILATALVYELELITANMADFLHIDQSLRINNPIG